MEGDSSEDVAIALAKLAGIRKAAESVLNEIVSHQRGRDNFHPHLVEHYFDGLDDNLETLRRELPDLYGDFAEGSTEPQVKMADLGREPPIPNHYSRAQVARLIRDIDQIFEIRANSELRSPAQAAAAAPRRVFITHGRSPDWREVQSYIERDLGYKTLELAQEPNIGTTVIEKLEANARQCDSAVIVMTGDDIDADGRSRARENVMHEIGFFQGRYRRARVCLLHEDGVSIPSNLSGAVYIPFPRGMVSASFHVLARELRAFYKT
jgi:predicted nucleotide-binding protein